MCRQTAPASTPLVETDRELIERHLLRVTLSMTAITLHLRQEIAGSETSGPQGLPAADSPAAVPTKVTIPWMVPAAAPVKGIVHVPAHNTPMKPGSRETLLIALAKARQWVKGIERGQTFADIADREGKAERHIRHLMRLAFVSPRIITSIIRDRNPNGRGRVVPFVGRDGWRLRAGYAPRARPEGDAPKSLPF
jgi:hypothetical protein